MVPRCQIPKNNAMYEMLWSYPENEFRQITRMNKTTFIRLANILNQNNIFHNNSSNKQAECWQQLLVVL